nr:MAG TPA: hypothetical protein [Caudoviricetes sp.]
MFLRGNFYNTHFRYIYIYIYHFRVIIKVINLERRLL